MTDPQPDPRFQTPWMRDRDRWVREAPDDQLLQVFADVSASGADLDENEGDRSETAQTLEWLASRGERGRDWGHAGVAAARLGFWSQEASVQPDPHDEVPVRFTVPMKPSFRTDVGRDKAMGAPIRWSLGDDVMMTGTVVDWTDEPDGSVTLTVEASSDPG